MGDPLRNFALRELAWAAFRALGRSDVAEKIAVIFLDGFPDGDWYIRRPCPTCGPYKRSARNRRRPVLRVYRLEPNFAGYHCTRCGDNGAALDRNGTPPDPMKFARARAEAAERERIVKADRLGLARWLWAKRKPISGSIAKTYLRSARGYGGRLPSPRRAFSLIAM